MTMQKLRSTCRFAAVALAVFLSLVVANAAGAASSVRAPAGEAVYLIQLEDAPLASYKGTVKGLAATSPRTTGAGKLDTRSAPARSYAAYLGRRRTDAVSRMESALGRSVDSVFQYDTAFNGLAVRMTSAEAATVAGLPGVVRVERDRLLQIQGLGGGAPPLLNATGQTTGRTYAGSSGPWALLLLSVLLLLALWGKARRRRQGSGLWLFVAAGLLVLMAACGGSDDEGGAETPLTVEAPNHLVPSPGAAWIGSKGVWTGADTGALPGTMGEGIVVGIIDSGISPHSLSFAAVGGDGYVNKNTRGKYYGVCDPENWEIYNPNFPCNDKLIGAWSFVSDDFNHTEGNPIDFNGHGSHVAATAAGNVVRKAVVHTPNGFNLSSDISGVAPHANIISYRVLDADGSGPASSILAGIEQAIEDGVDVINLSLGGGWDDPWEDTRLGLPLLSAREAGIFVAVAAGNDGPEPATVGTPGIDPWVTCVAAGTHDTAYVNGLSVSGGAWELADIVGLGLTVGYGPAPIVYAEDYGDPQCLGDFTGEFNGEIVLCERGEIARVDKGKNVKANGGGGMVLAEVDSGGEEALFADAHSLPAVHITRADADRLKDWLSQGTEHTATISGTVIDVDVNKADVVTGFSSRGWNRLVPGNVKPDILAPGASIFAPVIDGIGYAIWNGTSMASPHVAGVFALLKALHPDWTPSEAQSAVMTTAMQSAAQDYEGTPATPFDAGAGRIDAGLAVRAALVLDGTVESFERADPGRYWESDEPGIGDPSAMNLASLGDGACIGRCYWTRVIRSVSDGATAWNATVLADPSLSLSVEPESFSLAPGESVEILVTADVSGVAMDEWAFGRVVLKEADDEAPEAGLPVAVRSTREKLPPSLEIVTGEKSGSKQLHRMEAVGIGELAVSVMGLTPAVVVVDVLDSDPTPDDPFNEDGGIFLVRIDVPADASAFFVDLESEDSPDMDLYVGRDGSSEPLAESTSEDSDESVLVSAPQAGTWWIKVQNFASGRQADPFTLHYGVVSATDPDAGNLTATPDRTDGSPFGLTLDWKLPGTVAGDTWCGAIRLGTSAATPDDIGSIPVKLVVE